jgi:microcystin degradation protein MlrC
MRLLLAMFKHETNTFSPVSTRLERFFKGAPEPVGGAAALTAYRGTGSGLGGFIEVADHAGAEIVLPVAAEAPPSGPVDDAAYEGITGLILEQVARGGFDGILLDLHGAMVTQTLEDGEGTLLDRLRQLDAKTPVGIVLDMHANLYDAMVRNCTVVTGYHTYPHVDMFEAGRRSADILLRAIAGKVNPVMAWGNRPMLPHVMRQGTHAEPNRSLQSRCVDLEDSRALAASLFVGFPHADILNAGLSAIICTDNDPVLAARLRDELLDQAWSARRDFVFEPAPLRESVGRARQMTQGPVFLLDHYDNSASGGTMDTTAVLAEVLRQGLPNAAFYAIYDPKAAAMAAEAGIGANVSLTLGGQAELPSLGLPNPPLQVSVQVKFVFDGRYRNEGPMAKGIMNNTGTTAVLDSGKLEIVIISRHHEPFDMSCLQSAGIDPLKKRYVVLKSRVHWRAGFGKIATEVVECAGLGVTTSDYSQLTFCKVRRPIFPLDAI